MDEPKPQEAPQSIPFERGRSIVLTHYDFGGHQEVTTQWLQKHPEDNGELWSGTGATLREACHKAIESMLGKVESGERDV